MTLLWIDTETTGLSPVTCDLLEVACIVTTDDLTEVARFHRVVYSPIALDPSAHDVDPHVVAMHRKNGLWRESCEGHFVRHVDADLAIFILEHAVVMMLMTDPDTGEVRGKIEKPQLAGSTVSFDRAFMQTHLPKSFAEVHYRSLDVTSFNEAFRRFWPTIHDRRPRETCAAHRAMHDIEDSIRVFRHYVTACGRAFDFHHSLVGDESQKLLGAP